LSGPDALTETSRKTESDEKAQDRAEEQDKIKIVAYDAPVLLTLGQFGVKSRGRVQVQKADDLLKKTGEEREVAIGSRPQGAGNNGLRSDSYSHTDQVGYQFEQVAFSEGGFRSSAFSSIAM
jgi:hypothetical protein